eukprot:scaffold25036_cov166-Cylindrotheca_fusiformis.AAC.2
MVSGSKEELIDSLCWETIAPFCTLDQVLNARLVCRSFCKGIGNGLSLKVCADYLSQYLQERNIYFIPRLKDWDSSATQALDTDEVSSDDFRLDKLLHVLRVMKYLPKSMVVAFNATYGRHCLPVQWDETEEYPMYQTYDQCERGGSNCPTCRLKPKVQDGYSSYRPMNDVHDYAVAPNKRRQLLDLHEYAPICIPNLPNDLICPHCRVADRRTLVLSEFSYKSEHAAQPNRVRLSFTPSDDVYDDDDDYYNEGGFGNLAYRTNRILLTNRGLRYANQPDSDDDEDSFGSSSEEEEQPAPKRQKSGARAPARHRPGFRFAPKFDDMAIPTRRRPIQLKSHCKFAISIHCTNCQEFGIFAPAGVCWNRDFCCAYRKGEASETTLVGGALVRQRCSAKDCDLPIACPHCAQGSFLEQYEVTQDMQDGVTRPSHCATCNLTYCDRHADLSTSCNHPVASH